jgi:hypothetical protein
MKLRELTENVAAAISSKFKSVEIINDTDPAFGACRDTETLQLVLTTLLKEACGNAKNNHVRISARKFSNLKVIYIRYNDWRSKQAIETKIAYLQLFIEQLGGCLYVSNNRINGTTLSFTFTVRPAGIHTLRGISILRTIPAASLQASSRMAIPETGV